MMPELTNEICVLLEQKGYKPFEVIEAGRNREAAVRFHGDAQAWLVVMAAMLEKKVPIHYIRRYWELVDGEIIGPDWELTLRATRGRKGKK
jgi:hypothetical protein